VVQRFIRWGNVAGQMVSPRSVSILARTLRDDKYSIGVQRHDTIATQRCNKLTFDVVHSFEDSISFPVRERALLNVILELTTVSKHSTYRELDREMLKLFDVASGRRKSKSICFPGLCKRVRPYQLLASHLSANKKR
jgi:hypothetical protein